MAIRPFNEKPIYLLNTVNSGKSFSTGFDLFGRWQIGKSSTWASMSYVYYKSLKINTIGANGKSRETEIISKLNEASTFNMHRSGLGITKDFIITPSATFRSIPANVNSRNVIDPNKPWNNEFDPALYEINLFVNYTVGLGKNKMNYILTYSTLPTIKVFMWV